MKLFENIGEMLTLQGAAEKQGRRVNEQDLGVITKGCFVVHRGQLQWVGPRNKLPREFATKIKSSEDLKKQTVLPGFIECHTHLAFSGNRSHEFERRQLGATYLEIAKEGGGIQSTVRAVRSSSVGQLAKEAQTRVDQFVRQGVTTLEIKSGYGLSAEAEIKMLRAIKKLKGPHLVSTFLGAHAVAPEFASSQEYLLYLKKLLPQILKNRLASRVDIFVEKGFFEKAEAAEYLQYAREIGFDLTLHADQLTLSGGSDLAFVLSALSADHVLQIQEKQIEQFAKSEVTAVLLPLADFYMKISYPPARQLIDAGARVALATDFNPGTAPSQELSLTGLLARLQMKMTLPEVIGAYTVGAAYALKLQDQKGSIEAGKDADFFCTPLSWRELFYSVGSPSASQVYLRGKRIYKAQN